MWTHCSIDYVLDEFDLDTFDTAYFLVETARTRQELIQLQIMTHAARGTEEGYKKFVAERLASVGLDEQDVQEEVNDLDKLFHKLGSAF